MPSTIPYDPSLAMAQVVTKDMLDNILDSMKAQAPSDAADDRLNSLMANKRSLEMTKREISQLGIDTKDLDDQLIQIDVEIKETAKKHATAKLQSERDIQELRTKTTTSQNGVQSPVDSDKSSIQSMPLAADTVNMDVRYFPSDSNYESATTHSEAILSLVASETGWMGSTTSNKVAGAIEKQLSRHIGSKPLAGTLVISVGCTHKNATVLEPLVLDVDRGIALWNRIFPNEHIDTTNSKHMVKHLMTEHLMTEHDTANVHRYDIVYGTTFGSSFIGMIHILKSADSTVSDRMSALAASWQPEMPMAAYTSQQCSIAALMDKVKSILSAQNLEYRVTVNGTNALKVVDDTNKIVDIDSLLATLDEYFENVSSGDSGVPINYYLKEVTKDMLMGLWLAEHAPGSYLGIKIDDSEGSGPVQEGEGKAKL